MVGSISSIRFVSELASVQHLLHSTELNTAVLWSLGP